MISSAAPEFAAAGRKIGRAGCESARATREFARTFRESADAPDQIVRAPQEIAGVSQKLVEVTEKFAEVTQKFAEVTEKITGVTEEFTEATEKITEVTEKITEVTEEITGVTEKITEVTEKITEVTEKITEVTEKVAEVTEKVVLATEKIEFGCQSEAISRGFGPGCVTSPALIARRRALPSPAGIRIESPPTLTRPWGVNGHPDPRESARPCGNWSTISWPRRPASRSANGSRKIASGRALSIAELASQTLRSSGPELPNFWELDVGNRKRCPPHPRLSKTSTRSSPSAVNSPYSSQAGREVPSR